MISTYAWEIYWTDALIYVLLVSFSLFGFYARRKEHLRLAWRQVFSRRLAMASLVVLLAFVMVGILDSVHLRVETTDAQGQGTHSEVISVLDKIFYHLHEREEKTYSAPFAAFGYTRETVELAAGVQERVFARLRYGGAHLTDPSSQRTEDIVQTLLVSLAWTLVAWAVCVLLVSLAVSSSAGLSARSALRKIAAGSTQTPWRIILSMVAVMLFLMIASYQLSYDYHIFGTDKVGQDVFLQTLKSIRTGLVIGTLTTLVMLPFAVMMGIAAGYFRGWVDDVVQYLYTTLNAIPGVLLIAAAVLMLQVYIDTHAEIFDSERRADFRLLFLCIILGITSWTGLCRMLRGETLKVRELDYVQSAVAFGVGKFTVIFRHILPNVMHIILISVVLDFSGLVLAEAVLSYVGVGVHPTMNSWGNMINQARLELAREPVVWWSLLAALVFMFTMVLAANLFSDAVRDAFDPRVNK